MSLATSFSCSAFWLSPPAKSAEAAVAKGAEVAESVEVAESAEVAKSAEVANSAEVAAVNPEAPPLISRSNFFRPPAIFKPTLSPDGKLIAYLAPYGKKNVYEGETASSPPHYIGDRQIWNKHPVDQIWLRTLGKKDDRCITNTNSGVTWFEVEKDSNHVLFASRQDGNETHLYRADLIAGTVRDLSPFQHSSVGHCYYRSGNPTRVLASITFDNKKELPDFYNIDLNSGAMSLELKNTGRILPESISLDGYGKVRGYVEVAPNEHILYGKISSAKNFRVLGVYSDQDDCPMLNGWSNDGRMALLYERGKSGFMQVSKIDLQSNKRSDVLLQADKFDIANFWFKSIDDIDLYSILRDTDSLKANSARGKKDLAAIAKLNDGEPSIVSQDYLSNHFLIKFSHSDQPAIYYAFNREDGSGEFLFTAQPWLREQKLAKTSETYIQTQDGLSERVLFTPAYGQDPANKPLVVLVHGGPRDRVYQSCDPIVQWLANRGYSVLQPDFRGSSGHGRDFYRAAIGEYSGKCIQDIVDATDWAIANNHADASKVVALGGSFGGFAVLNLLAQHPGKYRCGIDVAGVSDKYQILSYQIQQAPWAKSGLATPMALPDDEKLLAEQGKKFGMPAKLAAEIKDPLLVGHGGKDSVVPLQHSLDIVAEMKKLHKFVELYRDENAGHHWLGAEFSAKCERFLGATVGGRVEYD